MFCRPACLGCRENRKTATETYAIASAGKVIDVDRHNGVFRLGIVLARHDDRNRGRIRQECRGLPAGGMGLFWLKGGGEPWLSGGGKEGRRRGDRRFFAGGDGMPTK